MSVDLNTRINVTGSIDEIMSILDVIRNFENKENDVYLHIPHIGNNSMKEFTKEEIVDMIGGDFGTIYIDAMGPYGMFIGLENSGLFQEISMAAPNAKFVGRINGTVRGVNMSLDGRLENGKLMLQSYCMSNDEIAELFYEHAKKLLPYEEFCKLFKLDEEEFDEELYFEFISGVKDEGFPEMSLDDFEYFCEEADLDEDEYDEAIAKVKARNFNCDTYDIFLESIETNHTENFVFDPITKEMEEI